MTNDEAGHPMPDSGQSGRATFRKHERLTSQKVIEDLFSRRQVQTAFLFPLLAVYKVQPLPSRAPAQVLFSVSKKKFKRAHDRNLIRRQLRECWRHRKNYLYDFLATQRLQASVVILYTAKEAVNYALLEKACERIIRKMVKDMQLAPEQAADSNR